jgi:2-oxoglutarate dehydrogenase E1 component
MEVEFRNLLQSKFEEAKGDFKPEPNVVPNTWEGYRKAATKDFESPANTAISEDKIKALGDKLTYIPDTKLPIKKVQKLFEERKKMLETGTFDWAMGELMAYASLLDEGHPVRLAGQDVERGTFSHRHAVVKKEDSEDEYVPLRHLSENQAAFSIYNSLLSEYAALGYEYGYSSTMPHGLTIWEAQFGDFSNGAQIIIDQFISSAEAKWGKFSGLVMLLPHGYEGQGPEHSSARLERYLQLCANNNMQVMNCSTPANLFHALRRQLKRDFELPLIIMTPKSLLRHPKCVSPISEFTSGAFQDLIDDANTAGKVRKVLFCTGKMYYDLLAKKEETGAKDIAIVRIEQLYPLPEWNLKKIFEKYEGAEFCWVQEEAMNQGSWLHLHRYEFPVKLTYHGRRSSASPATGFKKVHDKEQAAIVDAAFA